MKTLLFIILLLNSFTIFSQHKCKITYISNEGFLIETSNKKILIDALFNKIDAGWCDSPSDSIVSLMKKSLPPFNNIDIIAITHKHSDHFNEDIVIEHMINNSKAKVICPNQVNEILSKHSNYKKIKDRIIATTPNSLTDTNINVSNISIKLLRLEHSHYEIKDSLTGKMINKHQNIENLGYLFTINGTKIFHCGDTNPLNKEEYSTFSLNNQQIDIAFIERLFFGIYQEIATMKINEFINPKHTFLMHINPSNKRFFIDNLKQDKHIHVFKNKMETIEINP